MEVVKPLLPDRHPIKDFFVCDIMDAAPKDDMASMEHPLFSLSTKPDTRIRLYEHNGNSIKISPSMDGLATIHDKDVLIYCISQLMEKMKRGEKLDRTVHLKAHDLLVATNRPTDGDGYRRLKAAFERLRGTSITTNIMTNGEREIQGFGLIDSWKIIAKDKQSSRMVSVSVTLSEWMFNSVLGKEVLTLNRNYFRLRKPIERRVYEIARKHCGKNPKWQISLKLLQKKCGSSSPLREFRRMTNSLIENKHLPDYEVEMENDIVTFRPTRDFLNAINNKDVINNGVFPYSLTTDTYEQAKKAAPKWDVYVLEQQWIEYWRRTGEKPINNPDGAFIGFCKMKHEKQPRP